MSRPPEQMQPGAPQPGQPQLDTAATAGQAQATDEETAIYEQMVAGLRNHVFGKGEKGIVERLSQSKSAEQLVRALGETVFILVQEAAKQAEESGVPFDLDTLMGAATQLIDDIADLMEANGKPIPEDIRGDALMMANQLYVESSEPTDDEREAAKMSLAEQQKDGSVNEAVSYVQERGAMNGADPFGTEQMPQRPGMMGKRPPEE